MSEFVKLKDNENYSINRNGEIINKSGKKKALQNHDGYYEVSLYANGERTHKRVHRLVAETFIPNPDNKPEVNHKDGNKRNNSVDNLEWATKSENIQHAYKTGLNKPHPTYGMLGRKNPNAGRKGNKIRIVETGETFDSIKDCAESINGSDRRICDCINGKQQTHRDYHFERI